MLKNEGYRTTNRIRILQNIKMNLVRERVGNRLNVGKEDILGREGEEEKGEK